MHIILDGEVELVTYIKRHRLKDKHVLSVASDVYKDPGEMLKSFN